MLATVLHECDRTDGSIDELKAVTPLSTRARARACVCVCATPSALSTPFARFARRTSDV